MRFNSDFGSLFFLNIEKILGRRKTSAVLTKHLRGSYSEVGVPLMHKYIKSLACKTDAKLDMIREMSLSFKEESRRFGEHILDKANIGSSIKK